MDIENMVTKELFAEYIKRIDKQEIAIEQLKNQYNLLAIKHGETDVKLDNISKLSVELKEDIKKLSVELREDIKKLSERPAKRYDDLIKAGIVGVISLVVGIVTYFATKH